MTIFIISSLVFGLTRLFDLTQSYNYQKLESYLFSIRERSCFFVTLWEVVVSLLLTVSLNSVFGLLTGFTSLVASCPVWIFSTLCGYISPMHRKNLISEPLIVYVCVCFCRKFVLSSFGIWNLTR